MKETDEKAAKRQRSKPRDVPVPWAWAKFFWRDWLSDPRIRRLSHEQRSRFMDVWASTHGTPTPGLMSEDDVRGWAGFTPAEWKKHRDSYRPLFSVGRKGQWRLEEVEREFKASQEAAKVRRRVALAGVEKRRSNKDLATAGCTDGASDAPDSAPPVAPAVDHRGSEVQKSRSSEPQKSAVPELQSPDPAERETRAQSRGPAAGGTSGTDGPVSIGEVLARGLGAAALRPGYGNTGPTGETP